MDREIKGNFNFLLYIHFKNIFVTGQPKLIGCMYMFCVEKKKTVRLLKTQTHFIALAKVEAPAKNQEFGDVGRSTADGCLSS